MKKENRKKKINNSKENVEMAIDIPVKPVELEGKVKVSSKGQIVIPVEIRRAAGIKEGGGQELRYSFKNGKIILEMENYLSAGELLGFFDTEENNEEFVLDLNQAREDRSIEILNKGI